MFFRYIFAAAIKPIRLIILFLTWALSIFFPFVIGIAGTCAYVALITFDVSRKNFRKQIDLQYKIAALDYKWRRRAKALLETIEGAREFTANAPEEIKRDIERTNLYFDNIFDDSLKLLQAISNLEKFEKISSSESIKNKKAELIKRLEKTETEMKSIVGSTLLAISESSQIGSSEMESLNEDIKSLHEGLKEAREEVDMALKPDEELEKKFAELEDSSDPQEELPPDN